VTRILRAPHASVALFLICACASPAPAVRYQESQTHGLADEVAHSLTKAKIHTVAVFDFIGPGNKLNALGVDLADNLARTLRNRAQNITVLDRSAVRDLIEGNRVAPDVIRDKEIAWWLATKLNVDAVILGQLVPVGDEIKISIGFISTTNGDASAGYSIVTPLSSEMKSLLATAVGPAHSTNSSQPIPADTTMPKCIHCPSPNFSLAAIQEKVQGTAVLSAFIGLDGRARDIEILKPLSHRLTEQAIAAVQSWTFTPAVSAEGKPVEVEIPIEVAFKFSK
jgi:TonB family protein